MYLYEVLLFLFCVQFEGASEEDVLAASPPPPPSSPPPGSTPIFLYPGYTQYTLTKPGTAVLYTHPQPPTSLPSTPNGYPPHAAVYDNSSPFVTAYDNCVGNVAPYDTNGAVAPPFPAVNGSPFPTSESGSPFVS